MALLQQEVARLRSVHRHNVAMLRTQPWSELSGAFGDIGTFIPIFIALSQSGLISPAATLIFSGLANILTGVFFGIPLPVQPMKAIAAVVIASPANFRAESVASAGIFAGAVVAVLSAAGFLRWFTKTMPIPIVKGIQVSAGLNLVIAAMRGLDRAWYGFRIGNSSEIVQDLFIALLLIVCFLRPRLQFIGVIMVFAISVGLLNYCIDVILRGTHDPSPGIWHPRVLLPSSSDFLHGGFDAGLGQVPLTLLNSVVAVVFLAEELFPDNPIPSGTTIGLSVAAINLVGCWFGAMPVCHGSGGLAAQYRFGARSGASIIFLGTLKMITGLLIADLVVAWMDAFPDFVLSLLLVLAGMELVKMGENVNSAGARDLWEESTTDDPVAATTGAGSHFVEPDDQSRTRRYLQMMTTIGVTLGTHNVGIGFLAGLGLYLAYQSLDWDARRREGQIRLEDEATSTPNAA